jgi:hypothetical protein
MSETGIMMRTWRQIPLVWHPHDRSAIGLQHHTVCRVAQRIIKNGRGFSQSVFDEKGTAASSSAWSPPFSAFCFLA